MEHLQLPPERLWVSIYLDDDEAFEIWHKDVGLPAERIVRLGKEDNFWETGSGPCGPCSEIYLDRGPEFGCGQPDCRPGCDCERFLEFWNLVFIQFHQEGDEYIPLEAKSIDTGMGLERVAALLQGKNSIFEVDNIRPIVDAVGELAGVAYGASPQSDMSLRVIVDHLRAVTFLVADGVLPSNEGRVMCCAVCCGGCADARSSTLKSLWEQAVDWVVDQMKGYPELVERQEYEERNPPEEAGATLEQGPRPLQNWWTRPNPLAKIRSP